jgi:hypothetical protein
MRLHELLSNGVGAYTLQSWTARQATATHAVVTKMARGPSEYAKSGWQSLGHRDSSANTAPSRLDTIILKSLLSHERWKDLSFLTFF